MTDDLHRWLAAALDMEREHLRHFHQELLDTLTSHVQGVQRSEISQMTFGPKVLPPLVLRPPSSDTGETPQRIVHMPSFVNAEFSCPSIVHDAVQLEFLESQQPPAPGQTDTGTPALPSSEGLAGHIPKQVGSKLKFRQPLDKPQISRLHAFVYSPYFEMFFAIAICANSIVMFFQLQYIGMELGYQLKHESQTMDAAAAWPGADRLFYILEIGFGILFIMELISKLVVSQSIPCKDGWLLVDTVLVISWIIDQLAQLHLLVNPMIFRLVRMLRLVRLVRLARALSIFDNLDLILKALSSSCSVLLWSLVILMVVQICVGLIMRSAMQDYVVNEANPIQRRKEIYELFGTSTRSMVTMFEITLGNWVPVCRKLMEYVSEWYGLFTIMYKCTMGFAVVNVINAVFLSETLKVAHHDDQIMVTDKERAVQRHVKKMRALFEEADETGDGYLTFEETRKILDDPKVRMWLGAMDLEVSDTDILFRLLDDIKQHPDEGDCKISAEELCIGIGRLKGAARSIDMVKVLHDVDSLRKEFREVRFTNAG